MTPNYAITTVVTAASSFNLTTRARAKTVLSITDNSEDEYLDIIIPQVSTSVAQYCNRTFALQTYQDVIRNERDVRPYFLPNGRNPITLARSPLVSVATVVENDVTLVEGTDYEVDLENGQLFRLDTNGNPWQWPSFEIVVVYRAGYTLPGQTGSNALVDEAADVEDVTIRLIKARRDARNRDPYLRVTETAGLGRDEYWIPAGPTGNMTPDCSDVLDNYRIIATA